MSLSQPLHDWYYRDNLFDSRERMDEAHAPIVDAALRALGPRGGHVVDLGCGNGALLRKLAEAHPGVVPWGVERDPERIAHAGLLLPDAGERLVVADLLGETLPFQAARFALALVAARRFEEAGPERRPRLRRWIRDHCDALLVYGYGRVLRDASGLVGLCHRVGIRLADESAGVRVSLATRY